MEIPAQSDETNEMHHPLLERKPMRSKLVLALAVVGLSLTVSHAPARESDCPPKDTFVCTFQDGPDKGNEVILLRRPESYKIKNGAIFGTVMKKEKSAAIDGAPMRGSGQVYDLQTKSLEVIARFVELDQFDRSTDVKAMVAKKKTGTITVYPSSAQGYYEFDGGQRRLLLCTEKYFMQLNPHTSEQGLNDDDICKLLKGSLKGSEQRPNSPAVEKKTERKTRP